MIFNQKKLEVLVDTVNLLYAANFRPVKFKAEYMSLNWLLQDNRGATYDIGVMDDDGSVSRVEFIRWMLDGLNKEHKVSFEIDNFISCVNLDEFVSRYTLALEIRQLHL